MIELRWVKSGFKHVTNVVINENGDKLVLQYRTSATVEHGAGLSTVIQSEWQEVPIVDESN